MSDASGSIGGMAVLHPLYLDVQMMVSFLASLTDGVTFEDERTQRSEQAKARSREVGAGLRLPSISSLFGAEASGRLQRETSAEDSVEVKAVRQHTAASLFNALYQALEERNAIREITAQRDLDDLPPGSIVKVAGEFLGNPLQEIINFFSRALPYYALGEGPQESIQAAQAIDFESVQQGMTALQADVQALRQEATDLARSGNPERRAQATRLLEEAAEKEQQVEQATAEITAILQPILDWQNQNKGVAMLGQIQNDLAASPIHDTLLQGADISVVLTMSAEYYTDATGASLRAGIFTIIGKVTRVLREGDQINLLRRTVLAAAGPAFAKNLISESAESEDFAIETFDPIIEAPAVQVIPLAVFI